MIEPKCQARLHGGRLLRPSHQRPRSRAIKPNDELLALATVILWHMLPRSGLQRNWVRRLAAPRRLLSAKSSSRPRHGSPLLGYPKRKVHAYAASAQLVSTDTEKAALCPPVASHSPFAVERDSLSGVSRSPPTTRAGA